MIHWLFSLLAGTLSGTVAAMGLGGGFVLFLYLTLFTGLDFLQCQIINLLFFLPTAVSALICHARGGYLDKPTLKNAVPPAVAAALAGAWIATALDVELLRRPFGVYLLLSGVSLLWPQKRKKT